MKNSSPSPQLPGILVILSGPAGVGKTTVGESLVQNQQDYTRAITVTTREVRGQEKDGVDYHFYDKKRFLKELEAGLFLEHAEVHGKLYGTPLSAIIHPLEESKVLLLIIDIDGARQIRKLDLDVFSIFLAPPSQQELIERLKSRATEDQEKLRLRLERVERELGSAQEYDKVIINDHFEECVKEVAQAIKVQRQQLAKEQANGKILFPELKHLQKRIEAFSQEKT